MNPNQVEMQGPGPESQALHSHPCRRDALAGTLPFLAFWVGMILHGVLPPQWLDGPIGLWCYVALYIISILGLGIGWIRGFPRWSYAYGGPALAVLAWWGSSDNLHGGSFFRPAAEWLLWGTVLSALLYSRSLRPLGRFLKEMWKGRTQLSFPLMALLLAPALLGLLHHLLVPRQPQSAPKMAGG